MNKLIISKKDLKSNLETIRKMKDKKCKIIAVVKANGMGLDLIKYSKFLINNNIKYLAVSEAEEAFLLRKNNITVDVLLLTPENNEKVIEKLIKNKITLTISSIQQLETIKNISLTLKQRPKIHIKIDTGMGRYGFDCLEFKNIVKVFENTDFLDVEGVYTHFSNAIDEKSTKKQFQKFNQIIKYLNNNNYKVKMFHCCNSTAFIKYPQMHLDAVRLGSIIQGRTLIKIKDLRKIGFLKTNIKQIKQIKKGYTIGYGNVYKLNRNSKVAIIPVGHADGFEMQSKRDDFRFFENIKSVLIEVRKIFKSENAIVEIKENEYKVIGRVGLNYSAIDITDSNDEIKIEDEVILNIKPLNINCAIEREYI